LPLTIEKRSPSFLVLEAGASSILDDDARYPFALRVIADRTGLFGELAYFAVLEKREREARLKVGQQRRAGLREMLPRKFNQPILADTEGKFK
jgi:hypothetical protein